MFLFGRGFKKNKELEELIAGIHSNEANNYKDAAQECLKKYEARLRELEQDGSLDERQRAHYEAVLEDCRERMKDFFHREQKPYWT